MLPWGLDAADTPSSKHRLELFGVFDTDGRVSDMFGDAFIYQNLSFIYKIAQSYTQLLLFRGSKGIQEILVPQTSPIIENVIYFDSLTFSEKLCLDEKMKVLVPYQTEMQTSFEAQLGYRVRKKFMKGSSARISN